MSNLPRDADATPSKVRHAALASTALAGILLLALPVYAGVGWILYGQTGVWSAIVAFGVCLLSATGALMLTALARTGPQAINALLGGMALRMGVPLGIGFLLHVQHGPLSQAGILYMILAYYLLALLVETLLSLRLVGGFKTAPKGAKVSHGS